MIEIMRGKVIDIIAQDDKVTELLLDIHHNQKKAINYNDMTGKVSIGDEVIINTTACSLGLGTGGYHYVMANTNLNNKALSPGGHGMKVKYTPAQVKVMLAEESDSSYHDFFNTPIDLTGKVIIVGELHSMLPPLCTYFKYHTDNKIKIAYIMTDHGALPLAFSKNVAMLNKKKLLDITITTGNAFGGDFECVNIYTALKAAANIADCQVIIITMGPGIIGTDTRYGFSGLELGLYVNMIKSMGGFCLYAPRLNFGDSRVRHNGISHHSLTILDEIIKYPLPLVFPIMRKRQWQHIWCQLRQGGLSNKHHIALHDGSGIEKALHYYDIHPTTMGRGLGDDPIFFQGLGAIASYGLHYIKSLH